MLLLDAVNIGLTALGEARVTTTNIQHLTVDALLNAMTQHRKLLLERGWWFNSSTVTMSPNNAGNVEIPFASLSVLDTSDKRLVTVRNGLLFDSSNYTAVFDEAVELFAIYDVDFEDMPESAGLYVAYMAAAQVYSGDLGEDQSVQYLRSQAGMARIQLEQLHLRQMRYNTRKTAAYSRYFNSLRG